MKGKIIPLIVMLALAMVLVLGGCGGSKTTTSSTTTTSKPPTTSTTTTTTTTTTTSATTSTTTTTTSAGNPIPTTGVEIKTHNAAVLASYKDLCLMCHGQGAGASQYPLPPSYTSRSLSPGTTYTVASGVPGDHTGRTDNAACTAAGCHKAS